MKLQSFERTDRFKFFPLQLAHAVLLHRWLQELHVRAFWDDGDRLYSQVKAHYFQPRSVEQFLIFHENMPIGYIQSQVIDSKHEFGKMRAKTGETYGIDLFIGEKEFIGKGMATAILSAFIDTLREAHLNLKAVLFDPSENNPRAIHVFVKLGAKPIATHAEKVILILEIK